MSPPRRVGSEVCSSSCRDSGQNISRRTVPSLPLVRVCSCVFYIKPFFLPVDIQHNQCPSRFCNFREVQVVWSQNYAMEILHCYPASRVDNPMPCYHTGYDMDDIHILWKRENERNIEKTNKNTTKKKTKEKRKYKRNICRASSPEMWQTHKNIELKKQHHCI